MLQPGSEEFGRESGRTALPEGARAVAQGLRRASVSPTLVGGIAAVLDAVALALGIWFGGYASAGADFDALRTAGIAAGLALGLATLAWVLGDYRLRTLRRFGRSVARLLGLALATAMLAGIDPLATVLVAASVLLSRGLGCGAGRFSPRLRTHRASRGDRRWRRARAHRHDGAGGCRCRHPGLRHLRRPRRQPLAACGARGAEARHARRPRRLRARRRDRHADRDAAAPRGSAHPRGAESRRGAAGGRAALGLLRRPRLPAPRCLPRPRRDDRRDVAATASAAAVGQARARPRGHGRRGSAAIAGVAADRARDPDRDARPGALPPAAARLQPSPNRGLEVPFDVRRRLRPHRPPHRHTQ